MKFSGSSVARAKPISRRRIAASRSSTTRTRSRTTRRRGQVQGGGERLPDPLRRRSARALRSLRLRRHPRRRRRGRPRLPNVEDIFSAFGDLFGDFFGGRRAAAPPAARRGSARRPRADVRRGGMGCTKDVKVTRDDRVRDVQRHRRRAGSKPEVCRTCQGKGQVVHAQGFFMVQTTCPQCRGAGKTIKDPCQDCRGRGAKPETSTLTVTVPAGVDDGQTLRLAGKGETHRGGTTGHLYVVLHVEGDERLRATATNHQRSAGQLLQGGARRRGRDRHAREQLQRRPDIELSPGHSPVTRSCGAQGIPHVTSRAAAISTSGSRSRSRRSSLPTGKAPARAGDRHREDSVKAEKRGLFSSKEGARPTDCQRELLSGVAAVLSIGASR